MEDIIQPKRCTLAEEIGVTSKSTAKSLNVAAVKPQVVKLIKIKFDPHDVAAIKSPVEKVANKTELFEKVANKTELLEKVANKTKLLEKGAIKIDLVQDKEIVIDKQTVISSNPTKFRLTLNSLTWRTDGQRCSEYSCVGVRVSPLMDQIPITFIIEF